MKNFQYILLAFFLLQIASMKAQVQDSIRTDDIEIVKDYTPFVEDGKKQSFQPVMPTLENQNRGVLNYQIPTAFIQTQYAPDEIQPLPYNQQADREIRNVFIKGGYGTTKNPLLQFSLNAMESDNYTVGARGGYQAVTGDLIQQKMSDATLEVFGTKEIHKATLNASLGYDRNANWLYGFNQDDPNAISVQNIDKVFDVISGNIGIESANTDLNAVRHNTQANFSLLNENLAEMNETQFGIKTALEKRIFDGLDAKLGTDFTARTSKNESQPNQSLQEQKDNVLNITPSFIPTFNNGIEAEIGVSINNDKAHETKFFPHVKVEIPTNNEKFAFFAGWTGRTMNNGFLQLQEQNPRMSSQGPVKNYTKEIRTPLGIRGTISDQFSFTATLSQEVSRDVALWINYTDPDFQTYQANSVFLPFIEEKLTNMRPEVNANLQVGETVNLLTNFAYNIYNTEFNDEAWQLPKLEAGFSVGVQPIEQLQIIGDFNAYTGIPYLLRDGESGTLEGIFNANLGAQFDLNKQFSVFIDANNLANSNVEYWKNYPGVGTNILAGIVFSYD